MHHPHLPQERIQLPDPQRHRLAHQLLHVTGTPMSIGITGDRGFCSDNMNPVMLDPTGGANCTEPLQ
jgi:hypothetical protein